MTWALVAFGLISVGLTIAWFLPAPGIALCVIGLGCACRWELVRHDE